MLLICIYLNPINRSPVTLVSTSLFTGQQNLKKKFLLNNFQTLNRNSLYMKIKLTETRSIFLIELQYFLTGFKVWVSLCILLKKIKIA